MDIDFHFDATFVAAVLAGYSVDEATTIAHAGQYIDDSDESRLLNRAETRGLQPLPTALATTEVLSHAASANERTTLRDRQMWSSFHFLPGNLDLHVPYEGARTQSALFSTFSYGQIAEDQFRSMCLPDSPLAIAMVDDTREHYRQHLQMIGIRMHALIDTFAHMLYCGSAAWHVNDVGFTTEYQPAGSDHWTTFTVPIAGIVGAFYDSITYTGHSRMGHIPDYPWIKYRYQPQWSARPIEKDNPAKYMRAFEEMTHAMRCIRNNQVYAPGAYTLTGRLRTVIDGLIRKPHDRYRPFDDWTDDRRQNWKDALESLRSCAGEPQAAGLAHLPRSADYPVYAEDAWIQAHRAAVDKASTDYYRFHQAAHEQVAFVTRTVSEAGLPILGAFRAKTEEEYWFTLELLVDGVSQGFLGWDDDGWARLTGASQALYLEWYEYKGTMFIRNAKNNAWYMTVGTSAAREGYVGFYKFENAGWAGWSFDNGRAVSTINNQAMSLRPNNDGYIYCWNHYPTVEARAV